MATQLKLRDTTLNGITDAAVADLILDMVDAFGASSDTTVTNTTAGGTQIQLTKTVGGSTVAWISGRAPAGGFTLTAADISAWQRESNMNANIQGSFRIFKRTAAGVLTELAGGPFLDSAEMNTADREDLWTANPTDTAFAENDRIVLKVYLANFGTMGGGFTGTHTFNAASAATGDSFFNIAETVAFKAEAVIASGDGSSAGTSTVLAVGMALFLAVASAAGTSTATAVGEVVGGFTEATASAAGTSTAAGVGRSTGAGAGSAAGTATVSGVGRATFSAQGQAPASAIVTGIGRSTAASIGAAAGTSTASAVGASSGIGSGVGSAAGSSTAQGVGASTAVAVGASAGGSTVAGAGAAILSGVGASVGLSTTAGVGTSTGAGVGASTGSSTASATAISWAGAIAAASGTSTASAVGIDAGAPMLTAVARPGASMFSTTGSLTRNSTR